MSQFGGVTDEAPPLMRYLMKQASEDSPAANDLVAQIVELTKQSLEANTARGYVKPTVDPDMRAAILVMLRLGPFLLSGAVQQATGADILTPEGLRRMYRTTIEIVESGIYTREGVPHEGALLELYDANTGEKPMTAEPGTEYPALTGRKRWVALLFLAFGVAMIILDATVVNVAIPTMVEDLDLTTTDAEWVNSIYSLVFASLLLLSGRLSDIVGRRFMFLGGVTLFAVASVLVASSESSTR